MYKLFVLYDNKNVKEHICFYSQKNRIAVKYGIYKYSRPLQEFDGQTGYSNSIMQ